MASQNPGKRGSQSTPSSFAGVPDAGVRLRALCTLLTISQPIKKIPDRTVTKINMMGAPLSAIDNNEKTGIKLEGLCLHSVRHAKKLLAPLLVDFDYQNQE